MDFRLTRDQEALRRGMRDLLAARFGREVLRAAVDVADRADGADRAAGAAGADRAAGNDRSEGVDRSDGNDRSDGREGAGRGEGADGSGERFVPGGRLWRELGAAGLFALRVPERAGGVGSGLPEAVLVFEEAGRALLPGPLVAAELAARTGLVPGAAEGTVPVTAVAGTRAGDGALVEHLASAGAVLLLEEGRPARVLDPAALAAVPMRSADPLTPLHRVRVPRPGPDRAGGEAEYRAEGGTEGGAPDGGVLLLEGTLLAAAQQLGSARRTLELAVGYAREREQFGRPIGGFQAVQHLCAGMLVRSETARSVVYAAAVTADEAEIRAAKLLADTAAVGNARDCLQVYGGTGFTWEADVHLHLKRAWLRAEQWCAAADSEERLASALLRPVGR
ncbi:acyl-CoA dehydrogenase family protein [Streptomyces qinglanensis]|uniref:acyl-CoA dehydrogenase family protein n=1 Tax=Streptomyces qinglanensis TaxID=943816 RepID=UPI003D7314D8